MLFDLAVVPTFLESLKEVPPAHYKIQDAKGNCIIVEPTDGQLKVYDNPVWAMANSPEFPWHLTNLNNYLDLTPAYPAGKAIRGHNLAPFGASLQPARPGNQSAHANRVSPVRITNV